MGFSTVVTNICVDFKLQPPEKCPHRMKEICELLDDAPRGVTNVFLQIINLVPLAVEIT